jgi:hypothetical protein
MTYQENGNLSDRPERTGDTTTDWVLACLAFALLIFGALYAVSAEG